jgi:rsbT co-antagonist protein RsbR
VDTIIGVRRYFRRDDPMTPHASAASGAMALLTVVRRDGIIESAAPGFAEALGFERSALVGRSIFELAPEQDRPALEEAWRALRAGSAPSSFEVRLAGAGSALRWFAWQAVLDEPAGVVLAVVRDAPEIAERARVRRRELLLSTIAERAPIFAWMTDREGNCLEVIGRAPALLEGAERASDGQRVHEILEASPEMMDAVVRALEGADSFERYQVGDAALDIWLAPAGKEYGERAIVGVALDVSKEAEHAHERKLLRDVIERIDKAVQGGSVVILPVWKGVLCVPIMGSMGNLATAFELLRSVLHATRSHRARYIVLDLSGLDEIDVMIMDHILRIARSIQLLGAQVILTGIKPAVALTMVYLGVEITELLAFQTLEDALRMTMGAQVRRGL